MIKFMSILDLVKRILKMLLKIYDGFCVMMDFSYELFVVVKSWMRIPEFRGFGRPQGRSCESPRSVEILLDHMGRGWGGLYFS